MPKGSGNGIRPEESCFTKCFTERLSVNAPRTTVLYEGLADVKQCALVADRDVERLELKGLNRLLMFRIQ